MKKILFATSEAVPFIKTGGLADVAGSLPKFFDKEKYDVRVMLPKYMCMKESWKEKLQYKTHFYMDLGWRTQYVGVLETEYEGVTFYLCLYSKRIVSAISAMNSELVGFPFPPFTVYPNSSSRVSNFPLLHATSIA